MSISNEGELLNCQTFRDKDGKIVYFLYRTWQLRDDHRRKTEQQGFTFVKCYYHSVLMDKLREIENAGGTLQVDEEPKEETFA